MFLRQALRYRWSQMLVLAGVSVLIGACATFAPWFSRAVEQTVTTETLTSQWLPTSWQLDGSPPALVSGPSAAVAPEKLAELMPADLRPLFGRPTYGMTVAILWGVGQQKLVTEGRVAWRDGYCEKIVLTAGRCASAPNEVITSTEDVKNFGLTIGTVIKTASTSYAGGGLVRVVGNYRADDNDPYWYGRGPTGHSMPPSDSRPGISDQLLTGRDTLEKGWGAHTTSDTTLLPGKAGVDDLPRLRQATEESGSKAAEVDARNGSSLVDVVDGLKAERRQAVTIIPLVMVQVGLFGVVVLALALAAVVDQRRPELAISRLRGSGARRAGRALAAELCVPVLIGTLVGALAGFGLLLVVRATWLAGGAPIELPWTVPAAVALAALIGLGVVAAAIRTAVRQPISTLLRRIVPRRRGWSVGLIDIVIIVVASAGLLAALTGGGRGPLPVLTPSLLALAVGLTFAHLLLPVSGLISRRALRNGRLGLALGALQVARRPAVTRIVAVVAVATALVSFAGQASSVAGRNRDHRAGYEVGADGVLAIKVGSLAKFDAALDAVDHDRRWLTPIVLASPAGTDGLRTLMIEPDSFRRVAFHGDQLTDADGFRTLEAPAEPPAIAFRGDQLTMTVTLGAMSPYYPPTGDGEEPPPTPPAKSVVLRAAVFNDRTGIRSLVDFPPLPLESGKPIAVSAKVDCAQSCRLNRLSVVRELGDSAGLRGQITISKVATNSQPSVPLGKAADWNSPRLSGDAAAVGTITVTDGPPNGLVLDVTSTGGPLDLQTARIPVAIPALISPDFAASESQTVPGLDGLAVPIEKLDRLQSPIPRYSDEVAVVDVTTVRRLGGVLADRTAVFELWLNADGLARADQIIDGLGKAGITATLLDRKSDRVHSYDRSVSALALQLTPVIGVAGWGLAIIVLLLMIVTSWRSRAQDYASLRITGVPASTTGRAARWEQTGPVALAALLGSACGVVGAHVALPMIPLFAPTSQPSPVPLDLTTNWSVALILTLISTALMVATTLLLGTGVNRRAGYTRIREELS
ncbi:FtsX-like permease family protein [Streptomyces sp. SID13031]|uniref:FtsX-like permease family protein n=1 Tax=Streptomyces sp. SID13031 TaxID=2706046 RepID=UPI0013C812B2|nr:FtsX-like permease family protein [Streptomyces sp. SID13031]NEA37144.1 ABC transporter permease [Streptomyces sp. SID13031]